MFDPRPLPEIQGRGDEAADVASWMRRGQVLVERSIEDWPLMDWDAAAKAAHCFTIAEGLRLLDGAGS